MFSRRVGSSRAQNYAGQRWIARLAQTSGLGDTGRSISVDPLTGDIYVCGYNAVSSGAQPGFLTKISATGVLQWQKSFTYTASVYCWGVTVDGSGNVYVLGSNTNSTTFYFFLVSFDSGGTQRWQRVFNGTTASAGTDYGAIAYSTSTSSIYCFMSVANQINLLAKVSVSDGSVTWIKQLYQPLSQTGYGQCLVVDQNDCPYLVTTSTVNVTGATQPSIMAVKYKADGTGTFWETYIDSATGSDTGTAVAIDPTGTYIYVGGYTNYQSAASNDWCIAKVRTSDGVVTAQSHYGYSASQGTQLLLYGLIADPSGDSVYAIGSAYETTSLAKRNVIFAKVDSSLSSIIWQRVLSGPVTSGDASVGYSLTIDPYSTLYGVGATYSTSTDFDVGIFKVPTDGSSTGRYVLGSYSYFYTTAPYSFSMLSKTLNTVYFAANSISTTGITSANSGATVVTASLQSWSATRPTPIPTLSITPSTSQSFGSSVTFSLSLQANSGYNPTGNTTFSLNSVFYQNVAISNYSANYTDSTLVPGSYAVTANFSGDTNNLTTAVTVAQTYTVNKFPISGNVVASPSLISVGQTVTVTDTLSYSNIPASIFPTSNVSISIASNTVLSAVPVNNTLTFTGTWVGPVGTLAVWANYAGDTYFTTNTASTTLTVAKAQPSVTLRAPTTTANFGDTVSFTLTIAGGYNPSGTYSLIENTTGTPATLANGYALSVPNTTATYSAFGTGSHLLYFQYNGDTLNNSALSNTTTLIVKAAGSLSLSATPTTPMAYGGNVTLTSYFTQSYYPTGNVSYYANGVFVANVTPTGVGSSYYGNYTTNAFAIGTYSISSFYWGDTYNNPATSNTLTYTISKDPTILLLTSYATTVTVGNTVTLTANMVYLQNAGTITNTVTFTDGANTIATAIIVANIATATYTINSAGTHQINATYDPDTHYASSSNSVTLTVTKASPSIVFNVPQTSANVGQNVDLIANISAGFNLSGSVSFYDNATGTPSLVTTSNLVGNSVDTPYSLSAGPHVLYATYNGDTNNNTATSATDSVSIIAIPTVSLSTNVGSPQEFSNSILLTATVNSGYIPSGNIISFFDNSTLLANVILNASNVASLTIGNFAIGTHSLTALFPSNSYNNQASSAPISMVITKSNTVTTLVSNVTAFPMLLGNTVSFTANVYTDAAIFTPLMGGYISYQMNGVQFATGSVGASNTVTYSVTTAGNLNFSANYVGDANFYPSNSATLNYNAVAQPVMTVTASPNPTPKGNATTLNATLSGAYGLNGTETIGFYIDGVFAANVAAVNNTATYTSSLISSTHTVRAAYGPDSYNRITNGSTTFIVLGNAAATVALTGLTTQAYGNTETVVANVTSSNSALGFPQGNIYVYDVTGTLVGNGVLANTATAGLSTNTVKFVVGTGFSANIPGTNWVNVVYSGDTVYASSTLTKSTFTTVANTTTTITGLTASPVSPQSQASAVPITFTATYSNGFATNSSYESAQLFVNGTTVVSSYSTIPSTVTMPSTVTWTFNPVSLPAGNFAYSARSVNLYDTTVNSATSYYILTQNSVPQVSTNYNNQIYGASQITVQAFISNAGTVNAPVTGQMNVAVSGVSQPSIPQTNVAATATTSNIATNIYPNAGNTVLDLYYYGDPVNLAYNTIARGASYTLNIATAVTSVSTALTPVTQAVIGTSVSATLTMFRWNGSTFVNATPFPTGNTILLNTTNGTTIGANSLVSATGTVTYSGITFPTPGTYNLQANYFSNTTNFYSNSALLTYTITKAQPTLTLASNATTIRYPNQVLLLNATVSAGYNLPGNELISYTSNGSALISNTAVGNVAITPLPAGTLTPGTYTINASWAGDTNNNAVNQISSLTITSVKAGGPTIVLTSTPFNMSGFSTCVTTWTASFVTTSAYQLPGTQSVDFYWDGVKQATVNSVNNVATWANSMVLTGGAHTINAVYLGDANNNATFTQNTVNIYVQSSTFVNVTISPNVISIGNSTNLIANVGRYSVSSVVYTAPFANGTVTFSDISNASVVLGSGTLVNGNVSVIVTNATANYFSTISNHTIQANFVPSDLYTLANTGSSVVTITKAQPLVTSFTFNPVSGSDRYPNTAISVTAAIGATGGYKISGTQPIGFYANDALLGNVVAVGNSATYVINAGTYPSGVYTFNAVYYGDTYNNSATATTTYTVVKAGNPSIASLNRPYSFFMQSKYLKWTNPTTVALNVTNGFCIEFWANWTTVPVSTTFFYGDYLGTNHAAWGLSSTTMTIEYPITSVSWTSASSPAFFSLQTGTWYHIAMMCPPGSSTIYVSVNGVVSQITGLTATSYTYTNNFGFLNANIRDFRITTGTAVYDIRGFAPPIAPLTTTVSGGTVQILTLNDLTLTDSAGVSTSLSLTAGTYFPNTSSLGYFTSQSVTWDAYFLTGNAYQLPGTEPVSFYWDNVAQNTVNSVANIATWANTMTLSAGSHTLNMVYLGDAYNNATANQTTINVNVQSSTFVNFTVNAAVAIGNSVTFTANVGRYSGGSVVYTAPYANGTIILSDVTNSATINAAYINNSSVVVTATTNTLSPFLNSIGSHTVQANFAPTDFYTLANTATATINITKAQPTVTLASNIASGALRFPNQAVSFTATIAAGYRLPGNENVDFYIDGTLFSTNAAVGNVATTVIQANTAAFNAGVHTVNAVFNGDLLNNTATASTTYTVVKQATPTITLTATPYNTSGFTTCVTTWTATLGGSNYLNSTDYITFAWDGVAQANVATDANNVVNWSNTLALTAGAHTINAIYAGDAYNNATSIQTAFTVHVPSSTFVNATVNSTTLPVGGSLLFNANVGRYSGASVVYTAPFANGTVTLVDTLTNTTANSATIANGNTSYIFATGTTFFQSTGVHSMAANFTPSDQYTLPNSSTFNLTIVQAQPTLAAAFSPVTTTNTATTLTITPTLSGGFQKTGNVTIAISSNIAGSIYTGTLVNNTTSYSTTAGSLGLGSHLFTITVGQDKFNNASTITSTYTITKATPVVTLTLNPATANGAASTVSRWYANISGFYGSTASIQYYYDGNAFGGLVSTVNNSAYVDVTTSPTDVGVHNINAVFGGDTYNNKANTTNSTLTVTGVPTVTFTPSASATFGSSSTYTFTVVRTGVVPTGTVNLYVSTTSGGSTYTSVGSATLTNGNATLSYTPNLYSGTANMYARYNGDTYYSATNSSVSAVTINQGTPTVTLGVPTNPRAATSTVINVAVTGAAVTPTGNVTLNLTSGDYTYTSTGNLFANGTYQFGVTLANTSPAIRTYTANVTYNGDQKWTTNSSAITFNSNIAAPYVSQDVYYVSGPATYTYRWHINGAVGTYPAYGLTYQYGLVINYYKLSNTSILGGGYAMGPNNVTGTQLGRGQDANASDTFTIPSGYAYSNAQLFFTSRAGYGNSDNLPLANVIFTI